MKLKTLLVFLVLFSWFFSGFPQIWPLGKLGVNTIRIPPKIQEAQATTSTYCFNSYSSETWDGTPTNTVDCSIGTSTSDNNNGHYVHMDASEYTSGGTGTITKVEARVYYSNNWASSATTRNNVARLQPYFGGSNAGDTHNDAVGDHSTAGWSANFDITNDTNAPGSWTWTDVATLDMRLIDYRPSSGAIYVYRVEIIVTYTNNPPSLTVSQPDGVSDTVIVGQSYNITYDLSDTEDVATVDFYYDANGSGLDGTAITGCQDQAEGTAATCSWNTTGMTPGDYYVYGITTDGVNPNVNDYSPGVITIQAAVVSVAVSDGVVTYGMLPVNTSKTTLSGELNDMQTATNNGNVTENFNIKGQNTACSWTLASSVGNNQYVHQFCNDTDNDCSSPPTNYTALTTSYQTLDTGTAVSGTVDFQLRLTTPTDSSCFNQQSVDVVIQAVQQ